MPARDNDHKYESFDEEALMARKHRHAGYRFCPLCRTEMEERKLDGQIRLVCPDSSCGFIFYQNPTPAAGVIVAQENKVLLVKRAHPPKIGWWCIPAGFMEFNEHPTETAVRELLEETSLTIKLISFFNIYTGSDDPRTNSVLILYLGEITSGTPKADDDALDVDFFALDDLPDKIAFSSHHQALADFKKHLLSNETGNSPRNF